VPFLLEPVAAKLPFRAISVLPITEMERLTGFFSRRDVIATLTVVPLTYLYWQDLVESLDGSYKIAALIVVAAWVGIATDLNEHMTGQPEGGAHHHHD